MKALSDRINIQRLIQEAESQWIHWELPSRFKKGLLRPGTYAVSWDDFETKFATNDVRRELIAKMRKLAQLLGVSGCKYLYVGGSLVSSKEHPGDFDIVWVPAGVEWDRLLLVASQLLILPQAQRRDEYGGHVWMAGEEIRIMPPQYFPGVEALRLLRYNRLIGKRPVPVGVVLLDPRQA